MNKSVFYVFFYLQDFYKQKQTLIIFFISSILGGLNGLTTKFFISAYGIIRDSSNIISCGIGKHSSLESKPGFGLVKMN